MALESSKLVSEPSEQIKTRWRRIVTPIPAPDSIADIEKLRAMEPVSMQGMPPIQWHEAEGFLVRDAYGNQWIDLSSGIVAANAGHSHPHIAEAIRQAADRKLLFSYTFPTEVRRKLLTKLVDLAPFEDAKAIVFSAGTEVTECAMMLMRRHGCRISPSKCGILSFEAGYHGRTLAASLAGGVSKSTDWIKREQVHHFQIPFPFCPRCPWGRKDYQQCGQWCFNKCLDSLAQRNVKPRQIAGIIAESMPGWATWPLPKDFAKSMEDWARENDILITFDEIQSGCGRTGKFFAFEHFGVEPDLITLGKGLTSSLPVSALIGRKEIMDQPEPGDMSSTHGGNPICAAAAIANLEVIEHENLVSASAKTGKLVLGRLQALQREFPDYFYSIHGCGLFISAHLKRPHDGQPDIKLADAIVHQAVRRGVMMFPTARGFFKFVPPLSIYPDAALEAVDVIRECFREKSL